MPNEPKKLYTEVDDDIMSGGVTVVVKSGLFGYEHGKSLFEDESVVYPISVGRTNND